MSRYIDADGLKKSIIKRLGISDEKFLLAAEKMLYEEIGKMPTVDAVPVDYIARWMGKHQGLEYDGWNLAVGTMVADWRKENEQ